MQKVLSFLDNLEELGTDIASKLAPWLAPLLSAVVIGQAVMHPPFEWPIWQAVLTGAAIELSGVAVLNTALLLWATWSAAEPGKRPSVIPLALAVLCSGGYLVTALALTVVLKAWPGLEVLAYGLFVVLALVSAVNLTLRQDHRRRTAQPKRTTRKQKKRASDRSRFVPGDMNALDQANQTRQATVQHRRGQVADLLRAEHSQAEIARQLDVSESTIKRDVAALKDAGVYLNGQGV